MAVDESYGENCVAHCAFLVFVYHRFVSIYILNGNINEDLT